MSRLTGVVALIGGVLAWLVATVAVSQSTHWSVWAILPLTLLFGALVSAVNFAIAANPKRSWASVVGRGAVGVLVGAVVGEIAAVVVFSGSIDSRLDDEAARAADATPTVQAASAELARMRDARAALDTAVREARTHQDQALVIARCEYNPSPACPQTRITGVPGQGPETRTANDVLADTQRQLESALATRDAKAPPLDTEIASAESTLAQARRTAVTDADQGFGARWVAMHEHTLINAAATVLWAVTLAFFVLLALLPLLLKLLRGDTTRDRGVAAQNERDRAELDADTAIAVKRYQVRAEIENMWAEQQLASTRLAVAAQTEIDRELHRRRVADALDAPVQAELSRPPEPVEEDMYLPIEAEAQAASLLPARVTDEGDRRTSLPSIPDVTKAATRWIRPLVPPIVARVIDNSAHPLRTARQVFEEVEEITFSLKRTHKVTVRSEEHDVEQTQQHDAAGVRPSRVEHVGSSRVEQERRTELAQGDDAWQLGGHQHRRELPPAE
jgi:hypothetical protein